MIGPRVKIGNGCKIQNNVSLYDGVELADDVFCGPSCVFTNVNNPRANVSRKDEFRPPRSGGEPASAPMPPSFADTRSGEYCFVGAGAVVTKDVPAFAMMVGNPARRIGWMSKAGERLGAIDVVVEGNICDWSDAELMRNDEGPNNGRKPCHFRDRSYRMMMMGVAVIRRQSLGMAAVAWSNPATWCFMCVLFMGRFR